MGYGINKKTKNLLKLLVISNLFAYIKRRKLLKEHRKNKVSIGLFTSIINSILGKKVYIGSHVSIFNSKIDDFSYVNTNSSIRNTTIGKFCSIGSMVQLGLGNHPVNLISTHPAFYACNKVMTTFADKNYIEEYQDIKIGNDVWIGYAAIIMGGVEIGDGAVIAAGAIVTKNVESYSIVGGIPAKIIRYRFNIEVVNKLLRIKWWDKEEYWLRNNYILFHDAQNFVKYFDNLKNPDNS